MLAGIVRGVLAGDQTMKFIALLIIIGVTVLPEDAYAATGFLKSQEIIGHTRTCFYVANGSVLARTMQSKSICPASIEVEIPLPPQQEEQPEPDEDALIAYKTAERISARTKICLYVHMGSQYTKTISNTSLCPLTLSIDP